MHSAFVTNIIASQCTTSEREKSFIVQFIKLEVKIAIIFCTLWCQVFFTLMWCHVDYYHNISEQKNNSDYLGALGTMIMALKLVLYNFVKR